MSTSVVRGNPKASSTAKYTPRELSDAVEVIEWITSQPWSDGNVGMMGISWGGFNWPSRSPPSSRRGAQGTSSRSPRRSTATTTTSITRTARIFRRNLSWAATMLAYQSRPPDPEIVGDAWLDMWLERLEDEPFFMADWLAHQRRDEFWQHGSIGEDFDGFPVPALVIAGWADGYRNTPLKAVEGMPAKAKGLVGPWVHKYPHFAFPKPRADFIGEAISWWNRWLRDEYNGAGALPQMRAYILDGPRPALWRETDPGYWIAKDEWTAPELLHFNSRRGRQDFPNGQRTGKRYRHPALPRSIRVSGRVSGSRASPTPNLAGDQRIDDAGSLGFRQRTARRRIRYPGPAASSRSG